MGGMMYTVKELRKNLGKVLDEASVREVRVSRYGEVFVIKKDFYASDVKREVELRYGGVEGVRWI